MKQDVFQLLSPFRSQFTRKSTFIWFVVVLFGFLLRFDHYGVSSFVRWLHLPASSYPLLLNFFHSSAWSSGELMMRWIALSQEKFSLVSFHDRLLVLGDGIKVSKESQCQPGLKYLHSPSQNQSKPQRFMGHHFGCIAFVAEQKNEFRAILQAAQIHEGVDSLCKPEKREIKKKTQQSVVSRMLTLLVIVAKSQGQLMYAALDALFSTSVAFDIVFNNFNDNGLPWVHLITRAKSNYVGYTSTKRRKKERVKLSDLFNYIELFSEHPHPLHPKRTIKIYPDNLYWGTKNFLLRFVWVMDGKNKFILMSSDLLLDPLVILKFYGLRFQIEFSFRVLKHMIGGFNYRFWSTLCRRKKLKPKQSLVSVDNKRNEAIVKKSILKLNAIERFVNLAIIAQGILSYLAFAKSKCIWDIHQASSWLRCYSSNIPSDETVQRALQSHLLTSFSLGMIKDWVNLGEPLKIPGKCYKVRRDHTLEHFLSG
jgi:hypothetical protein